MKVFSADFAGLLPRTSRKKKRVLVFVEQLTEWPPVEDTERSAAEKAKFSMQEEFMPLFGAPTVNISDNATCFMSQVLRDFKSMQRAECHPVLR